MQCIFAVDRRRQTTLAYPECLMAKWNVVWKCPDEGSEGCYRVRKFPGRPLPLALRVPHGGVTGTACVCLPTKMRKRHGLADFKWLWLCASESIGLGKELGPITPSYFRIPAWVSS